MRVEKECESEKMCELRRTREFSTRSLRVEKECELRRLVRVEKECSDSHLRRRASREGVRVEKEGEFSGVRVEKEGESEKDLRVPSQGGRVEKECE